MRILVVDDEPALRSSLERALGLDAYDVELAKMKASGEFAKIIEPYGFSAAAAMSTTREKLCAAK